MSPDRRTAAFWTDIGDSNRSVRVVSVVDLKEKEQLLSFATDPRYTGAVWNVAGSRCALYNAPDNANTALWMVSRKTDDLWTTTGIDLSDLLYRSVPEAEHKPFRGGILQVRWTPEDTLFLQTVYHNVRYDVFLRADGSLLRVTRSGPK